PQAAAVPADRARGWLHVGPGSWVASSRQPWFLVAPMRAHWGVATCSFLTVGESLSLRRVLPRGLFWRSLIIIVAPIVLLQAIIAYVFFERDLDTTTRRLARDV